MLSPFLPCAWPGAQTVVDRRRPSGLPSARWSVAVKCPLYALFIQILKDNAYLFILLLYSRIVIYMCETQPLFTHLCVLRLEDMP